MYSTCTHCYSDLGANEILEAFPIGSRLAFDSRNGRLWVICRACARWNLTPLEERWEAIGAAERVFARSRILAATENISLARAADRTALIRIGEPRQAEVASWRYGDTFVQRWRKTLLFGTAFVSITAVGAAASLNVVMAAVPGAAALVHVPAWLLTSYSRRRVIARVPQVDGSLATIRGRHMDSARLISRADGDWFLSVAHDQGDRTFDGMDAVHMLRPLMTFVNRHGARGKVLNEALGELNQFGSPLDALRAIAMANRIHPMTEYPKVIRLALEIVVADEVESRAVKGEVSYLERAWREAEEIAAIADGLLVSEAVESHFQRLNGRSVTG